MVLYTLPLIRRQKLDVISSPTGLCGSHTIDRMLCDHVVRHGGPEHRSRGKEAQHNEIL